MAEPYVSPCCHVTLSCVAEEATAYTSTFTGRPGGLRGTNCPNEFACHITQKERAITNTHAHEQQRTQGGWWKKGGYTDSPASRCPAWRGP